MSEYLNDLTGQVVAITGASSGIGFSTAKLLLKNGATVLAGSRDVSSLKTLSEEYDSRRVIVKPVDVSNIDSVKSFFKYGYDCLGKINSVVANAGIGCYGGILSTTNEQINQMIDVNFKGTVWTVRESLPYLLKNHFSNLIILSSVAGLRGGSDEAVYAGTKFSQIGLAGALDRELREKNVRVTAICPAGTNTNFAIGTGREKNDASLNNYMLPEDVAYQIVTCLRQPNRLRTSLWSTYSMLQSS